MISPKSFLYEVDDGTATITLNRPERLNALTFEVYRELTDTFAALQSSDEVRVVVITGAGRGIGRPGLGERDSEGHDQQEQPPHGRHRSPAPMRVVLADVRVQRGRTVIAPPAASGEASR